VVLAKLIVSVQSGLPSRVAWSSILGFSLLVSPDLLNYRLLWLRKDYRGPENAEILFDFEADEEFSPTEADHRIGSGRSFELVLRRGHSTGALSNRSLIVSVISLLL